jgi:FkbM family methyltransferase
MREWKPQRLPDGHFTFEDDDCLCRMMREAGRLDHDQWFLGEIMRHIRPGTGVIDGGAFLGDHAISYARVAQSVLAIEACWPTYLGLCANVFVGRHTNVMPIYSALANMGELHHVSLAGSNWGAFRLVSGPSNSVPTPPSFSIDALKALAGVDRREVSLIKLDIEGWEVCALAGARELIAQDCPTLVVEVNEGALAAKDCTPRDLLELIESFGYTWRALQGREGEPQWDLIATPKGAGL